MSLFISLTLNVVSSVGVIFINKSLVYDSAKFHFGTALTIVHFIVTFLGCLLFARLRFFEPKQLHFRQVIAISLAFCGYVVFNNLSLLFNTVPIYQISKIVCTPVIVACEYLFYQKSQSRETLVSLIPVCLGIFITVYAETTITAVGIFWAALAVVANSFYTIWGKTKQTDLKVTPMQILLYQAPLSAVILIFALPLMDPWRDLVSYQWTGYSVFAILISCVFAFGVNFSFFLFVGQTSPLTTNVLGYLKTCLVFIGNFLFFHAQLTAQNALGIGLTLLGLAMYSKAQMATKPAPTIVPGTLLATTTAHVVAPTSANPNA